jgi:NADH dehydrogenase
MILLAGGTGRLGRQVTQLLTARGCDVRILTRDPARGQQLAGPRVELAAGDVRDHAAVERAIAGARVVVSAMHGFAGTGDCNPRTVDGVGNHNLIQAARAAGVEHVILVSVHGAAAEHPMELFRMKYQAEQELRASGLNWTILRPTAYMETWGALIGEPLLKTGQTRIFGRGVNPINFVSAHDVARYVELAVVHPALRGVVLEIGGPANLSLLEVARTFETVTGKSGARRHIPLPMMRVMARIMRPLTPALARQIQAGVVLDTRDMTFDASETMRRYPTIVPTSFAEAVRRDYVENV